MEKKFSEKIMVEKPALKIFKDLDWDIFIVNENEKDGLIGRKSKKEVILKDKFEEAIKSLNPKLPQKAIDKAYEEINKFDTFKNLEVINKEIYEVLTKSLEITYEETPGKPNKKVFVKLFDFDNPEKNKFLAVSQMRIEKDGHEAIPDILGFVNGIPLLFIELKAPNVNLQKAYFDNLANYKENVPNLFYYNAFIILSNGIDTKIGSLTSRYEHFYEWKRIEENEKGKVSLETVLKGVCEKNRFMDFFENFILYTTQAGNLLKLIARNHQFLGVNKAIKAFKENESDKKKLGVFWHTQGSGKTYSMVFFCKKIFRKISNNYSFVIVTDREELDRQIYAGFKSTGIITISNVQAKNSNHLQKLLKENKSFVFTLIHKFVDNKVITDRENIIVISDEAHRTQNGLLALNMRTALPNASFIGFTGTPIIKGEAEITKEVFGDYVSIYNFKDSINDKCTVPLYYENRGELLGIINPKLNKQIKEKIEKANLTLEEKWKVSRAYYKAYPVMTAKKRLESIAKDIVWHFNNRGFNGKGMLVCIDKLTAFKMYSLIKQHWAIYLEEVKEEIKYAKDEQELSEKNDVLKWLSETEILVIISEDKSEVTKFKRQNFDITSYRKSLVGRNLEEEFKNPEHPFRLAIVCSMWITGFDVPSLSTVYIDKPLTGHALMQTIARANRIYKEKNNGLIIDYVDSYINLLKALGIYAVNKNKEKEDIKDVNPLEKIEKLEKELNLSIKKYYTFFEKNNHSIKNILVKGLDLNQLYETVNLICTNDKIKAEFRVLSNNVYNKFTALVPHPSIEKYKTECKNIKKIYETYLAHIEPNNINNLMQDLQTLVDESIIIKESPDVKEGIKTDLGGLNYEALLLMFNKSMYKNLVFTKVGKTIEKRIEELLQRNPFQGDYLKKYNEIIERYNKSKDEKTIKKAFEEIIKINEQITEDEKRAIAEGLTGVQFVVYEKICSKISTKKRLTKKEYNNIKQIVIELLEGVLNEKLKIDSFYKKADVLAKIRLEIANRIRNEVPVGISSFDIANEVIDYFTFLYKDNIVN